tara:strand:- start:280 stop:810 length:531 start_codon:yes stop_codon:yes gene_type:complete
MITKFKIIQSSPPHTGSTLLLNLIHGYLSPDEIIHWNTEKLIDKFLITKTHNTNIEFWEKTYPQYKLFFIMSERNDDKIKKMINSKYRQKSNVLIINYDKLLVNDNSQKNLINYIFNQFNDFIPKELKPNKDDDLIKDDIEKRLNIMNETVEKMKHKKFCEWDKFTGIHGSHRNRG